MQPSAAASFCGTTAARKLAFGRTIRGRFGRRTRFDRAGNPEVMDVLGFRDYCLSLPLSGEAPPFDETTLVCKIGGRMYACADRAESVALRSSATPGRRSPCVKDMPKRSLPVISIKSIGPAFVRRAICPMRVSASRFAAPACSFSKALRPGPAGKRSAPASKIGTARIAVPIRFGRFLALCFGASRAILPLAVRPSCRRRTGGCLALVCLFPHILSSLRFLRDLHGCVFGAAFPGSGFPSACLLDVFSWQTGFALFSRSYILLARLHPVRIPQPSVAGTVSIRCGRA